MSNNNTALGIDENIEALLCYIVGWITGIVFLFVEKKNEFVRFHAMQSLAIFAGLFIIGILAPIIPILGWIISLLMFPVGIVLWFLLMYKAYKGKRYKLPYIGDFSEKQLNKNINNSD